MVGGRLRRGDRLRSAKDFRRVGRHASRRSSRHFVVLSAPRREGEPGAGARLGLTVSRRVGNAVARNRVKRLIREWFRTQRHLLGERDLVVIARPGAAGLGAIEAARELSELAGPSLPSRGRWHEASSSC